MKQIIATSYFPKELPPPFNTRSCADFFTSSIPALYELPIDSAGKLKSGKSYISKPAIHNLARAGTLRRRLSIPNPVAFYQITNAIVRSWTEVQTAVTKSKLSLTAPAYSKTSARAIHPRSAFSALPAARARARAGKRYALVTDLNMFYPSIYTHSIPWALDGKSVAKKNKYDFTRLGNVMDVAVRNGQDQQTAGIPIGPDTSLVIAEIILSAVDERIQKASWGGGHRYIDDYEFCFRTLAETETALAEMQEFLSPFELQLNPKKSKIIELPAPLEAFWVPHLRLFPFRKSPKTQTYDLLGFLGRAFELASDHRQEPILKYALSRIASEVIDPVNWSLYEDLLLQCLAVEAGTISHVISELYRYRTVSPLNFDRIKVTLEDVIKLHAPLGHGSEVAWAIWGMIALNLSIDVSAANTAGKMDDCVVALLSLDARGRGLIPATADFSRWATQMTNENLATEYWLLAYEARIKGWLPSYKSTKNYITSNPQFGPLQASGVSFYDTSATVVHTPLATSKDETYDLFDEDENLFGVSG